MGGCLTKQSSSNQQQKQKNTQLKEGQNREKQYQPSEEDPRLEVQYEDEDNLTKSNKNADGNQEQFGNNDDFVNRDRACKIDWEGIGIQQPNFVNFITPITNQGDSTNNQFLVSAENAVHQFDINSKTGIFEHLGTVIPHDKTINMTTMLNQELFLVCSRDPIVRMFELPSQSNLNQSNFDKLTQPQAEFIGHTMSVTSITASSCQQFIASGSRDQTTRLWDIESQKQLQSRLIERNAITFLKWLPNHQDRFIECSEDLTLRLWDIRSKPFKPQIEFKVGANFATTCDILSEGTDDKYLVTGHRGFNDVGADIKLWDLRNFSQESLKWTYTKHRFNPESVRFIENEQKPLIISASKDQSMHVIDTESSDQIDCYKHSESYISMSVVSNTQSESLIVAADVKAQVMLYLFNHKNNTLKEC